VIRSAAGAGSASTPRVGRRGPGPARVSPADPRGALHALREMGGVTQQNAAAEQSSATAHELAASDGANQAPHGAARREPSAAAARPAAG
jgi:hypothetical protein